MFKRLGKALSSKNRSKVRLDCSISCLRGLPPSVGAVRVVWARDAKVQMTKLAQVHAGEATWREELSIIATLDKNSAGGYEPKTYDFRIQAPGTDQRFVTLGLVTVDMAKFVDARSLPLELPVNLSGGGGQAVLCITLTSIPVRGLIGDDAASVISGLSGSPNALDGDQDLGGFEMQRGSSPSRKRDTSPTSRPPPPPSVEERKSVGLPESTAAALDTIPESAGPASPVGAPDDVDDRLQQRQQAGLSGAGSADLGGVAGAAQGPAASELRSAFAGLQDAENGQHGEEEGYEEDVEEFDEEEEEEEEAVQYVSGVGFTEDDLLELEARLTEAETAAAEAEAVAEEAVAMYDKEQQLRQQAEAMAAQLQHDLDWAAKKAVKERTDWEGRMKDSFKKMEGTVLLTERVQREKAELAERLATVTAEKNNLEAMFDHKKVEMRVSEAVVAARADAEAQAGIEIAALKKRVREMEEYVEEADSRALQAQGKASTLQAQLAGARGASAPSGDAAWDEVRAAEERADGLSLELQYARAERTAMEEEVRSAKQDADRSIAAARREAEAHAARAAELMRQLEGARASAVAAERNFSEAQGRMVLLEDALERSNLQAAELRQRLVAAQAQGGGGAGMAVAGGAAAAGLASELALAMQEVREVQDAAEARAAQLSATSRELQAAQEALSAAQAELQSARQEAADAHRMVEARDDEVRHLQDQVKSKESVAMELKQAQRELAGMYGGGGSFSGAGRAQSSRSDSGSAPMHAAGTAAAAMQQQTGNGGAFESHEQEYRELEQRAAEAEALARSLSMQTADLVQQLATSQAERLEANAKIGEMRGDIARLRSGSEGQLRQRIEALDRELQVSRNRAEVNALFREEHERIAGDLIVAKLALAEAQEEIVVLKRSLVKSQERSMGFAAKLTRLETKLYKRLTNAASSVGRRKKGESSAEEMEESLEGTPPRPGSRSSRPSSAGSSRAGSLRRKLRMVRLSSSGQESGGEGLQSPTPHQQLTPSEK